MQSGFCELFGPSVVLSQDVRIISSSSTIIHCNQHFCFASIVLSNLMFLDKIKY